MPLTLLPGHDTLVFRSHELTGASPCTMVDPKDHIQDQGHDKSPPLRMDSSSNPVVLTSHIMTKVPTELFASSSLFIFTDHLFDQCMNKSPPLGRNSLDSEPSGLLLLHITP